MNADDGCDVELQSPHVLIERPVAGVDRRRLRIVKVRLHDDLLFRDVHDQHAYSMGQTQDAMQFDVSRIVAEDVLLPCGLEDVAFGPLLWRRQRESVWL